MKRQGAVVRRLYRMGLRLFPSRLRENHGGEMEEMFADAWRDASRLGWTARLRLAARTTRDLTFNGAAARLEGGGGMETWRQDIRYAVRGLVRRPGFALVATFTLALGIGGNTAIYSIVDAAWVDALPFPDDDRLVVPYNVPAPERGGGFAAFSAPFYAALRDAGAFASLTDVVPGSANVGGEDRPERVSAARVNASFFDVAGIAPAHGRAFTEEEAVPGGPDVVVISHGLWTRRFAADPNTVGGPLVVDGTSAVVVGVMPAGFDLLFHDVDLWRPTHVDEAAFTSSSAVNNNRRLIGRLDPGVSSGSADARLTAAVDAMRQRFPDALTPSHDVRLVPLREHLYGSARGSLAVLSGAVAFVLLIACANLANLLLVRGEARRGELAVRAALGASRGRLVRSLITESLLLAVLGGALGLLLATGVLEAVRPLAPDNIPTPDSALDGSVLAVTALLTLATGVLFGLVPAWAVARSDLRSELISGGQSGTGAGRPAAGSALVVTEVALTAVLLVGSGLLLNSMWRLQSVDPGFETEHRTQVPVELAAARYPDSESALGFHRRLVQRVAALPGVVDAGMGQFIPMAGASNWGYQVEGKEENGVSFADYTLITPGYLEVMEQRITRGRALTWQDAEVSASPVVLVSEAMARRRWPGKDPIGRRINVNRGGAIWREVVGVVSDVRNRSLGEEPGDLLYFPAIGLPMASPRQMTLVVHHANDRAPVAEMRAILSSLDATLPMSRIQPLEEVVRASEGRRFFLMTLLGLFAAIALALAAVGLYGVVSYSVALRSREIGLRMAVGASRGSVVGMVLRQSATLVGVGLAVGLVAAVATSRLLESVLFGVGATDIGTYGAVALFLSLVAGLATWLPAARATRVDPASVLRR